MLCLNKDKMSGCDRMKCVYTTPVGKKYRYRIYFCANCGSDWETVECPRYLGLHNSTIRIMGAIGAKQAKRMRTWIGKRKKAIAWDC